MSIIPAFGRVRQEDQEFKASLGFIVRPPSQKQNGGGGGGPMYTHVSKCKND
jgi:hypothetical protein